MNRRNIFLLILTAVIWGVAFVAQSAGGDVVGSYTFNFVRFIIGGIVLLPVIKYLDKCGSGKKPDNNIDKRTLFTGGILCGLILCVASCLQQIGINSGTSAGKAGFLTACYVIIVPLMSVFLRKKVGLNVWISVVLAVIGLYFLCINGKMEIQMSDGLVMICAFVFSLHIIVIDHFSPMVDGVRMSCIQFFTAGILAGVPMLIFEVRPFDGGFNQWMSAFLLLDAWIPILYAGVLSCGVAYTLQIVAQNGVDPTIASLLLSLESVFSVIAGWIILGQAMSLRALSGCALIFGAVVLAQINFKKKTNTVQL